MQIKHLAAAIALAATAMAGQATTLTFTPVGDGSNFATFDGNTGYAMFDFMAAAGDQLNIADLTSTWTHSNAQPNVLLTGYHITNVKFDGVSLTSLTGGSYLPTATVGSTRTSVKDGWTLTDTALTMGMHTIEVWGTYNLQISKGFTGNITVTPVPEPETYGMLLGGLGVLALAARRRKAG